GQRAFGEPRFVGQWPVVQGELGHAGMLPSAPTMKGHAIISHGLQSGPDATKATALARAAEALGWSTELPDYRDIDAKGVLGDVPARIARLRALAERAPRPLVLAGSSMGAYIS